MNVVKRNGSKQKVSIDKIITRLGKVKGSLVTIEGLAQKIFDGLIDNIATRDIDTLASEISASMTTIHPEYSLLAARLLISRCHKETSSLFSENLQYNVLRYSKQILCKVDEYSDDLNGMVNHERDYLFDYFGFKTLEKSYLLKKERPQYMWMRCAIFINLKSEDFLVNVFETYTLLSLKYYTHASPTLSSSGLVTSQLASCFLLTIRDDSIEGIFDTVKQCALVSKQSGGIGLSVSNVRAAGSEIVSTGGTSSGLLPMLRLFNNAVKYVDQGGNKRSGSCAIWLEPWHADIYAFLDAKKNIGAEELRARDLFYGLWVPDLFMERVETDGEWTLMCPQKCPDLYDLVGEDFKRRYEMYENEKRGNRVVKARDLFQYICQTQIEVGLPYLSFKDSANRKSNQNNLGVIRGSNLCTEIIQYSDKTQVAVCNLASIALCRFVSETGGFDFENFGQVVRSVTRALNNAIDLTNYPLPEAELSNKDNRPIGIGVQGFADMLFMMKLSFESEETRVLNKKIFEHLYFNALLESCDLAQKLGPYKTFPGSMTCYGKLQFDLWPNVNLTLDWSELRESIKRHGLRNSLLIAPMPTATTAQILGNVESFEPISSNIFSRRVLSGEFQVVNKHLVKELEQLNLWSIDIKNEIIQNNGSVQKVSSIPHDVRFRYKTIFELKQKVLVDLALDRAPFIDQSQSINIHMDRPTVKRVSLMHQYAWKNGAKNSSYYLRTKAASNALKFSQKVNKVCDDVCDSCSS